MKVYLGISIKVFIVCCVLLPGARNGFGQGQITFTILPNVTRITDCETGQLVGGGYSAAYYWAPNSTFDRAQFTQVGAPVAVIGGTLMGGMRTITGPSPGSSVNLYAAAWESAYGNSYEIASLVPGAKVGCSDIVTVLNGGSVRIPDFQVCPVPEPSVWGLVASGVGLLLFLRKRTRPLV